MPQPSTFNSPQRVVVLAMKNAGLLQEGDEPNSEQYAEGLGRLNDLINMAQVTGLKLWREVDTPIPLVAGTPSYALGPGVGRALRVGGAYFLDLNSIKTPLTVLSWDEYTRLSQVSQLGPINSYFVDKQATFANVFFWLTPDAQAATGTAHVIIQQQIPNVTGLTDTLVFPQEWFLYLQWALADEWATGQPLDVQQRCTTKAELYRLRLEEWDVEDAPTFFQPDQRSMYASGNFR